MPRQINEDKPQNNPVKCICGKQPVIVKANGKTMVACKDLVSCRMRGPWASGELAAIDGWYIAVSEAKHRRKESKTNG